MKYAKILLFLSLSSLRGFCGDPEINDKIDAEHALDYSSKNVCEIKFTEQDVNVKEFLEDCTQKDKIIEEHTKKGIEALRVRTGFLANQGIADIINALSGSSFFKHLRVLDLSYNRATKQIFSQEHFEKNLKSLLEKSTFQFLDICGNYVAGIDSKDFFATLKIDLLKKIIWIHKGHLNSLSWAGVVREYDSQPRLTSDIKEIKKFHVTYYNAKIEYNSQFDLENQKRKDVSEDTLKIPDWNNFLLSTVTQAVSDTNMIPDAQIGYECLIDFSRNEEEDRHENRLELAKRIYHESNFRNTQQIPSLAARMFHTIKGDKDINSIIRGEATYYLAEIYKNGAGLPYNPEKADKLFEEAKSLGF